MGLVTARLDTINPNPWWPEEGYDQGRLDALAASIRAVGFWGSFVAREVAPGCYQIPFAHHRWKAASDHYGPEHEVSIDLQDLSDEDMVKMVVLENDPAYSRTFYDTLMGVRTVLDAAAEGKITLPVPTKHAETRTSKDPFGGSQPYTALTVSTFLGRNIKDGDGEQAGPDVAAAVRAWDDVILPMGVVPQVFKKLGVQSAGRVLNLAESVHAAALWKGADKKDPEAYANKAAVKAVTDATEALAEGTARVEFIEPKEKLEPMSDSVRLDRLFAWAEKGCQQGEAWDIIVAYGPKSPKRIEKLKEVLSRLAKRAVNRANDLEV